MNTCSHFPWAFTGRGILGPLPALLKMFKEPPNSFPQRPPCWTVSASGPEFQFLRILTNTSCLSFRWYPPRWVWRGVSPWFGLSSLMSDDVEYLCTGIWPFIRRLWRRLFTFLAWCFTGLIVFLLWWCKSPCMFWTVALCQICDPATTFSQSGGPLFAVLIVTLRSTMFFSFGDASFIYLFCGCLRFWCHSSKTMVYSEVAKIYICYFLRV